MQTPSSRHLDNVVKISKIFAIHKIFHFKRNVTFIKFSPGKIWPFMYSFKIFEKGYYNWKMVIFYG